MDAAGARRTGKKRKAKAKVAANAAAKEVVVEVNNVPKPKVVSLAAQSKATKKKTSGGQTTAAPTVTKADAQSTATQGEAASLGKKSKKKRKKKKNQAATSEQAMTQAIASAPTEPTAPAKPQLTAAETTTAKTSSIAKNKQSAAAAPAVPAPKPAQKRKIGQIAASDAKASTIVTIGNSEKPAVSPKRKIVILNSSAKKIKLSAATTTAAAVKTPVKKPSPILKTASPVLAPKSPSNPSAVPMPSLVANVVPKVDFTPQPVNKAIKTDEPTTKQKSVRLQEKQTAAPSGKPMEAQSKTSSVTANPLIPQITTDLLLGIAAKPPALEIEENVAPVEGIAGSSKSTDHHDHLPTIATSFTTTNEEVVLADLPTLEDVLPEKTMATSDLLDLPSLEEILPVKTTTMPELISLPSTPEGIADTLADAGARLEMLETVHANSTPPFVNDLPSEHRADLDYLGEWSDHASRLQMESSPVSVLDTHRTTEDVKSAFIYESVEEEQKSDLNHQKEKRKVDEPIEILTDDESDADEPSGNSSDGMPPSKIGNFSDTERRDSENQDAKERILDAPQLTQLTTVEDTSILQSALPSKQETRMVHSWGPSFGRIPVPSPTEESMSDILSTTPLSSWFLSKGAANFIKHVVSPARFARKSRSPEKRVRPSSAPMRQLPVQEEADEEDLTEGKRNKFLESLALQPAWRSWFTKTHLAGVLDPPLAHVPESVQNYFDAIEHPTEEMQAKGPCDSDKVEFKPTIAVLEEEIRREKERGKAFDQELLLMLQGRTLSGKDFEAEYATLLPTATTRT